MAAVIGVKLVSAVTAELPWPFASKVRASTSESIGHGN